MSVKLKITVPELRRLAIRKQFLTADAPPPMLEMVQEMGCLQLDPISAVERSHLLVLWSRLGHAISEDDINKLIYEDKSLFEYWAHVASIVPTADYPFHAHRMKSYPQLSENSQWHQEFSKWLDDVESHDPPLSQIILDALRENGPMSTKEFDDPDGRWRRETGWSSSNGFNRMMDILWGQGKVMVAHRQGKQRYWDLAERCLPDWTPREDINADEITYRAAQRAVKALGAATPQQIKVHFIRYRYENLQENLDRLVTDGPLIPVELVDQKGDYYIHTDDLPLLESIRAGEFAPRTTLLSPFDNLICDRDRTEMLWDFYFRIEIYVPKAKRQYGYYVLPILHGDDLIGRIDPRYDRKTNTLEVNNIYAEDDAPQTVATQKAIASSIQSLATFLGADKIEVDNTPDRWSKLPQYLG